jgi:hypothetical protein
MKYYETHFEEYITSNNIENLHPELDKIYEKFPSNLQKLKNIIFFGPKGVGKYTQMLKSIKKYSPSNLKYEKKISVTFDKSQYFFKISDIHYEVDMSLLGCNSKLLWHEIYFQIIDIISTKTDKSGIIVCKYFNEIHSELLDNFYSYIQQNITLSIDLKFILITEELSFIPDNIINSCFTINVQRPTRTKYIKCINNKVNKVNNINKIKLENITNIKLLNLNNENLMLNYKIICNKIIHNIVNFNDIDFLNFRDILYDIFIYKLDISNCIWYILSSLIEENYIQEQHLHNILIKTYCFFQYYNNNYRPIYHLENYLYNIIKITQYE